MSNLSKRVYEMRFKGVPDENIARAFELNDANEVEELCGYFKQEVRQFLKTKTVEDFTFDCFMGLNTIRNMALDKFHEIDLQKVRVLPDGSVEKVTCCDYPAQAAFLQIALDAEKHLETMTYELKGLLKEEGFSNEPA